MVAIVAGNGLGLLNTSLTIIGGAGVLGQSVLGRGSSRAIVNAVSGNLILQMQDAQLAGRGPDLHALRTYNSLGALNDGDGDDWRWVYEKTVRFQGRGTPVQPQAGATVIRTDGDGHEATYTWNAARAAYISTEGGGAHNELRYDSAPGEWVWTDGSTRVLEQYSNSTSSSMTGRLIRRTDTSSNSIILTYDGGRLTLIQDPASQQELRLKYGLFNGVSRLQRLETRALIDDASGRATATLGSGLRQVEYTYDSLGRLTAVTSVLTPADGGIADGAVFVTNYTYDGTTTRIAGVTQSDGTSAFFTYDAAGRVRTVKDHGGATSTQLEFTYGTATNSTAITDGNGQAWTYGYDATSKQLTEILTATAGGATLSTKFTYDANGNLVTITDASNNTVTYGYDSNGNRTLERDALGNTVTRTFSTLNQMLTETRYRNADPDGAGAQNARDPLTTRYVYDENSRLRFVVSAEGRVTENRYGSPSVGYGLLTHTLKYTGQVYDLTGISPSEQLTDAQLTAWVAGLQGKTQVQLTEYSYDLRGNLSRQTSYATVIATGAGVLDGQAAVTEYIYDAHSRLRQQIVVRGSSRDQRAVVTSAVYDGMGRVLTNAGVNGTQTTTHDDANRSVTVTGASGLTETRRYDNRGRLVSVDQAGDATTRETRYVYNNADQLRMLEDAQGGRRYRFYDAVGRLEYEVDATGAVKRFEYNATGQLVRRTQYQNRADTTSWYDGATQTVTKLSLTAGGPGSDVPADATHDRVTTFGYDAAGRLTTTTDPHNTVTTTRYDGLSRVIMKQTGDRATRYLYDNDSRQVGVVDALGYLTESKYDAGGRLIETVRYSQRSPGAANIATPVWIGVTNQSAIGGRPFEYRVPAYDADGDHLTFSVVGAPPAWLSFDAGTATLRGTPPALAASYNITLRADDGRGKTSDVTLLIAVTNTAPGGGQAGAGPTWVTLAPLDVVTDTPVTYVVPAATGHPLAYRVVCGMPPGLSFNATTRTITGTSRAVGFYTILLRATNASGQSVDRTVSVQIRTGAATPDQPVGSNELSTWRPADTSALHSYVYYDGQGRVAGSVDEQQFLTEAVYDDALNTQRTLRYLTPVTVAPSDTLASLKSRAGVPCQTSLVQNDGFGRVREVTALDGSTVTRNEYDKAGRLTRVVTAADTTEQRARRTLYNAFGEVTATLGGEGDAWLGANPTPQRVSDAIRDYGIRHEYDTLGRAIRRVDTNGNKALLYYDGENRLTHTVNVLGQSANNTLAGEVSETKYNAFGQIESVRRYAMRLADADMDQLLTGGGDGSADQSLLSRLTALANQGLDQVNSYEYDRCGRLVKEADGEHGVTINIYNAHGELAAQVRSILEGRSTTKQFDYDLNGRVVSQTDDAGGINSNIGTAYDAFGRVTQSVDGAGKVTTTAYQDSGRTVVATDPLVRTTRTESDALGRALRVTNALNQQTVYRYTEAARSVTVTTPEGVQVTTVRNRHDETLSVTDGRGNVTRYAYNREGQPTKVIDALGRVIAYTIYDRGGRQVKVTDARATVTLFGYDQRNRVVKRRVDPDGLNLTTLFEFDALGQQIKVTEGSNTLAARVTTYAYDRKGRVKRVVVDPAPRGLQLSTSYSYDDLGNTVAVARGTPSNPNQHVVLHEFDSLGRRVKEVAAPSSVFGAGAPGARDLTTHYRYDAGGRVSRRIDANGHSTWFVYDAAGQLTHTINALGEVSEGKYDAAGRSVHSRSYLNRLSPSTVAALGDVVGSLVPPAATANDELAYVVYDNDGRARFTLKAIGSSGWAISENRHDANGNVLESRRYDKSLSNARVAAIESAGSSGVTLPEVENELKNTLGYSDAPSSLAGVQRTRLAYDANNRLRFTVDPSGSVVESVYDAAGSAVSTIRFAARPTLTEYTESAINAAVNRNDPNNQATRFAYSAENRLRYTVDALGSVSGKEYDARGNVVKSVRWAARPTLTQYSESAIATALAALPGTGINEATRFVYDTGNRLRFTIGALGSVTENVYDAVGNVVATTRFARRPTAPITSFTEGEVNAAVAPLRGDGANQVIRFAHDANSRLRFTVDALGSVSEKVYDASGGVVVATRFATRPALLQHTESAIEAAVAPLRADGHNQTTRFAYDAQNRLRFTVDALGSVSESVYDALGNVSTVLRHAVRPTLTQYTASAIDAAVATERGNPGNQIQQYIRDAAGQVRFSVQRLSVEAGQARYQVTKQELNALGQTVSTTAYATAVALSAFNEAAIAAAVGSGDPSKDRVAGFVFDVEGRQVYALQAVTLEGGQRKYQVGAQQFDALGRVVSSTTYATAVTVNAFEKAAIDAAVNAVADGTRDRVSAAAFDAKDRLVYRVRVLGPGSHQVVKQEYDALDRVVRTTEYAKAVGPLANFERATIESGANAVAGADDRKVQYVYDAVGRQRFVLRTDSDAHWTVAESRYDVVGNLVEGRRYDRHVTDPWIAAVDAANTAGVSEQEVLAELGSLGYSDSTPSTLANLQRTRFAYDLQNQLHFTIDALGSITENVFDALGNVVAKVRFAARPPLAEYTEGAVSAAVNHDDANNEVQHVAYDAGGQVRFNVQVSEPNVGSGGKHTIDEQRYDALGRLVERRAYATELGHLTAYDELSLAAAIVPDAVNDRRSANAYDGGGRQVYTVRELRVGADNKFVVTRHVHDALGQVVQRIEYASPVALMQFDKASIDGAVVPQFSNDRTTTYVHDAAGRMRFEISPDLSFRESVYDALNQVTRTQQFGVRLSSNVPRTEAEMVALRGNRALGDGATRGHAHAYDAAGRLTSTVDALNNIERYEYNALGDRTRWIDKNGNGWTYEYDRKGQKVKEISPPAQFKVSGEEIGTAAPNRVLESRFAYDAFGNLIRKIEAANFPNDARTTESLYDTVGRLTSTLDHGYYDAAAGRVERDPGVNRFRRDAATVYDPLGNAVRTSIRTGANALQHTYRTYDRRGQVVHEVNALNNVTRYTYTPFREPRTVTRHSVTIAGTPANGMYWTAAEVDPLLNFGHDENGNLLPDVYARTITMAYDKLGRKIAVTQPTATYYSTHTPGDDGQVNYFRPNPGSVAGVQDAAVTRYEYNAFGDLTLQRVRINNIVEWQDTSFTYDAAGRRTRSVDAAGFATLMNYDSAGNLVYTDESTGVPVGTGRITEFAYNALNQQTRVDRYGLRYTDADGVEHGMAVWTWDNGGEWLDPDAEVATTVKTTTYDGYGRVLSVTDGTGNVTSMRYNALGQLFQVTEPARLVAPIAANGESAVDPFRNQVTESPVTSLTLDPFGRAVRLVRTTSQSQDARETLQAYDAGDNLISTTDAEGGVKLRSYDYAGRVIKETQAIHADLGPMGINNQGLERRYVYDALGQLTDTLDVYLDGTDLMQSGKSAVYNAFGEVVEERRKWGPASQSLATLNMARVAWHHYDNAGHVFEKLAADRLTVYYYNLLGQVTREEKRGNSSDADGTGWRITETQYDVLGRAIMIRKPAFDANITIETGTTVRLVTPYSSRTFDRWGNVIGTQEGGYQFVNGQPVFAPHALYQISRGYEYDDNNQLVAESLGKHEFVSSSGGFSAALIYKRLFRDLLGNVVKEVDEARDTHESEGLISSRTRRKQYNSVGQLTAEIDATNRKVEYAYSIHGSRLGTRNARGMVFFDRHDRNGNVRFHGVLRTSGPAGAGEYDSHAGTGAIVRTYLNANLYDQANRRFASKTFTEGADAPWSYAWLDARHYGVLHRDEMGVVTQCRYDPFGNKAVEIDGAGARKEWDAATEDYIVGRIERYLYPDDTGIKFGSYTYNDFGELKVDAVGNARTVYDRHKNGLLFTVTIMPDVTKPNLREVTTYYYDARGPLTSESRTDATSIQTRFISYDNQGRLSRVEDQNKVPAGPICDVRYAYDEWGNVRRIQATYKPTAADGPFPRDSWYEYDAAGRLTVSNGILSGDTIAPKLRTSGSVQIDYDSVGRRSATTEYASHHSALLQTLLRTWDTMRDEQYEYNDLGHLRRIEQRIRHVNIVETAESGPGEPVSKPDRVGSWRPLSDRAANLRGDVTHAEQWSRISGTLNNIQTDQVPAHLSTTTTVYRADGQVAWTKTDADDPKRSTDTQNTYNGQNGELDAYVFNAFRSDGVPFTTRFEYHYTFQNGGRAVRRIRDISNGMETTKTYDRLGRLSSERVDLPKPNGDGSDRYEERFYEYGADGRVIFKDAHLRLSANGPGTVPLPTPSTGQQTYVYAAQRMAATVGAQRLAGATKFDFAYTPMSEAAGSGASRYVVQGGDSLIAIAQTSYGDSALWYVIADANGITGEPEDPLPTTEVGKAYEIPDVVRSSYSVSTFKPYALAEIIGNDRPITIPSPPAPKHSDLELMALAAVSITLQVGVTVGLTALGVPAPVSYAIGAGLSNLGGQATSWGLGMQAPGQDGIDWGGVIVATAEGSVFSSIGSLGVLGREVWQQAKSDFNGWTSGPGVNWTGIAGSVFNVGFDALGPVLGGPKVGSFNFGLAGLINSAYNPSSGWAIPGSGRSPTVGAFEYAYGAVANGLADIGYNWIRDRLERPSAPAKAPRPRSVDDPRGPLPAELIDLFDKVDQEYIQELDRAALAAANERIAAAGDESLRWQLRWGAMQDLIDHYGEGLDDRAIIGSALRQRNAERLQREQATAAARAYAALKAARRRAESARLEALRGIPDPNLLQYARDMDEVNNLIVRDMYADASLVRVSTSSELDGLKLEGASGILDRMGLYTHSGNYDTWRRYSRRITLGDEEINSYREFQRNDPSLVGLEIIIVEALVTPAEQARRTGLAYVATFNQFSKSYALTHKSSDGVEKAFIDYHFKRCKEITDAWDRIDRAAGAVNFITKVTGAGVEFLFDPAGTVGSLVVPWGTEKVLRAAGVDEQTAAMISGIAGVATGGAISYRQMAKVQPSVRDLLGAERAARAEYDAARLAAQAAEFEASKGVRVAEGVTLFKGIPAEAMAARPAGYVSPLLDAPPASTPLALAGDVPMSGGLPAIPGRDFFVPGGHPLVYEATGLHAGVSPMFRGNALQIGGFEPTSRLVANISEGSGGFAGGTIRAAASRAGATPALPAIMTGGAMAPVPAQALATKLAPPWLETAIARSEVQSFVFHSIAQDAGQLADWNRALRTVFARPNSLYAGTIGQPVTRLVFDEVNEVFFKLRGIAGAGTHNVHHWNALKRSPEYGLDPRNLFLVESGLKDGHRIGEHIFLHWMTRSGNPYRGPLRPGGELDLGWPRSVIDALE
jgi:YD repeat-containing protein